MKLVRFFAFGLAVSLVGLVACSSDDSGSTSSASSTSPGGCAEAKTVADECNAKQPSDGGAKLTVKFDQAKCESSGEQGKKAADCIVAHRDNCDCLLECSLTGSCSK